MEQINVTLFDRNKGLLLGILTYCLCATIALFLPYLFHHPSNPVFFCSAVIFIVFPLLVFPYISRKCLNQALFTFNESGFGLQETQHESSLVVHWQDMISFRMQPFKIMIGKGVRMKIYYNDGGSLTVYLFGIDMLRETVNGQLFIQTFFHRVNRYNLQVEPDKQIMLLPGFFATELGKYLMIFPALLVVFDLYYRISHPLESKKGIMFFLFAVVLAAGFWEQVQKERKSFEKLSNIQNENS